jgi:alkanesulfonate monooxygenase SsuD/methylene tetrahydromethanopterin reductase-like flavin-dependent oxidoreductase (luciferase family)
MPAPLRLGFLTHLHGTAEPRRLYRDYVELFVAAEELGFDSSSSSSAAPRRGDHRP